MAIFSATDNISVLFNCVFSLHDFGIIVSRQTLREQRCAARQGARLFLCLPFDLAPRKPVLSAYLDWYLDPLQFLVFAHVATQLDLGLRNAHLRR